MKITHIHTLNGLIVKFNNKCIWHNNTGPAFIEYDSCGNILNLIWYYKDKVYRKYKPSCFRFLKGFIKYKEFKVNNIVHNEICPAIIEYNDKCEIIKKEWWLNGHFYDKLSFINRIKEYYGNDVYNAFLKKEAINMFD